MTAIYGTNSAFEVGPEFRVMANLVGDGAAIGKVYMRRIEWGGCKYEQHLAKIPDTNDQANVTDSRLKTHFEIVSLDLWNRSPTCLIVKPVTQVYRKIANCSSSET